MKKKRQRRWTTIEQVYVKKQKLDALLPKGQVQQVVAWFNFDSIQKTAKFFLSILKCEPSN
jgi:hypothetical protein